MQRIQQDLDIWLKLFSQSSSNILNPELMMIKQFSRQDDSLSFSQQHQIEDCFMENSQVNKFENQHHNNQKQDPLILQVLQQENELDQNLRKSKCSCKKSFCLKSYCQCFASGGKCSQNCGCLNCENTQEIKFQRDKLEKTKKNKKHSAGCTCKKSKCLKKYCQCFNSGLKCTESCKCEGCQNLLDSSNKMQPEKNEQLYQVSAFMTLEIN